MIIIFADRVHDEKMLETTVIESSFIIVSIGQLHILPDLPSLLL
jgi:hypothetical protein